MKNKLEVKGVSKVYANVKVLSDITFVLENGIYGLIGPNGAGKSTLIRLITTLEKNDEGTILYNGKSCLITEKLSTNAFWWNETKAHVCSSFVK